MKKNKKYAVWGRALLALALISVCNVLAFSGNKAEGGNSITICHLPPGNPANVLTITVSVNALPAHLAHGDVLGDCIADTSGVSVGPH